MGETDMSILQRLLAIRDRMSAQAATTVVRQAPEAPAEPPVAEAPALPVDAEAPAQPAPADDGSVSMWDLVAEAETLSTAEPAPFDASRGEGPEAMTGIAPPHRRSGRVKTRLIGFEHASGETTPAFDPAKRDAPAFEFPVGWLVIVAGPGRGTSIPLAAGVSQIGRGDDQAVQLDFGDTSISRSNHAAVAYDDEQRAFFIGHGGKANLVRRNGKPVLSTEQLLNGDELRIGETTLRFVALCDEAFSWSGQIGSASAVNE